MRAVILGAIAIVSGPVFAQDFSACTAIENDTSRLACFDLFAADTTGQHKTDDHWVSQTTINPMDDTPSILVGTLSETGNTCHGQPARLIIRCDSGIPSVIIRHGCFIYADESGTHEAKMRFGTEPPLTRRMYVSTNNKAFGFWEEAAVRPNLSKMLQADRLVVEIKPKDDGTHIAVFDLNGLSEELVQSHLLEACNLSDMVQE